MRQIRFDGVTFEPESGLLRRDDGGETTLRPKSAVALSHLLGRAPEIVSREELARAVWPDRRVRDYEAGLSAILHELREALGDDASQPRWLETLPRRGYRLLVTPRPDRRGWRMPVGLWVLAAVLLIGGGVTVWWYSQPPPGWRGQVAVVPVIVYPGAGEEPAAGEPSWLLTDTLIAELWRRRPEGVQVIGRSSLARGDSPRTTARRLGERLGVDWVLYGWARPGDEGWAFTLSLYAMPDAQVRWSATFETRLLPSERPEDLASRAVESLVAAGSKGF